MSLMDNSLAAIRLRRNHLIRTAEVLVNINPEPEVAEKLTWPMLLDVPSWCYWAPEKREQLILIAGALYAAPEMKLWIDTKLINKAIKALGAEIFELIMLNESISRERSQLLEVDDVCHLFTTLGSGVLMASIESSAIRDSLAPLFPESTSLPQYSLATALAAQAIVLLEKQQTTATSSMT